MAAFFSGVVPDGAFRPGRPLFPSTPREGDAAPEAAVPFSAGDGTAAGCSWISVMSLICAPVIGFLCCLAKFYGMRAVSICTCLFSPC